MTEQIEVHTNNVPRDLVYFSDLTEKQQAQVGKDYDYLFENDCDWIESEEFVIYKGEVYPLSEFIRVHGNPDMRYIPEWLKEWDAYNSFGYVGGLVIKFARMDYNPNEPDYERVIVGWY